MKARRIPSLLLVFVMIFSILSITMTTNAVSFSYSDVNDGMWSYGDIKYVTENGLGIIDDKDKDDDLEDNERIAYLREHIRMVWRAIRAGANVKGYYYWSHFDSLESLAGYQRKFGLLRVNLETGERTRKKSWYYYQKLVKSCVVD